MVPAGLGQAGPVRVQRGTFEAAEAAWLVRQDGGIYMYFVLAYRLSKPLGPDRTRLFVDRSRCRTHRAKRKRLASCSLEGRVQVLEASDLRVGPLLSDAVLRFGPHRMRWTGTRMREPQVDPFVDPSAAFADAYLERMAGAAGRLFGRKMPRRALDHASLSLGAYVSVITAGPNARDEIRFEATAELRERR
ncbi:MAG: hypothetical protein M3N53_06715 [Actinomycetota bacterium]|nr:hypothetical protein [Actinomycetota bacterium]